LERENRAFFVPFVHPWGWATWRRAWKRFSLDAPPLPRSLLKSRSFRRFFDVNRLTEATLLIDLEQRGLVSSWFIQWHRTVFLAGGLSLFPSRPLVMNRGVTIGGTHAGPLNPYPLLVRAPVLETDRPPELPTAVTPDFPAMDLMASGRDARMQRFVAVGGKFKRLLKRWLLGPR